MLHVINLEKLIVPITQLSPITPEIQRTIITKQVEEIYARELEYYNVYNKYLIAGCISICKVSTHNIEYLIDGQHRLCAYKLLASNFPERILMICVDYYTVAKVSDIDVLYGSVNTCTPNPVSTLGIDKYKILRTIEQYFTTNFPSYISKSKSPKYPNINISCISNTINESQVIEKSGLSGEQICAL